MKPPRPPRFAEGEPWWPLNWKRANKHKYGFDCPVATLCLPNNKLFRVFDRRDDPRTTDKYKGKLVLYVAHYEQWAQEILHRGKGVPYPDLLSLRCALIELGGDDET